MRRHSDVCTLCEYSSQEELNINPCPCCANEDLQAEVTRLSHWEEDHATIQMDYLLLQFENKKQAERITELENGDKNKAYMKRIIFSYIDNNRHEDRCQRGDYGEGKCNCLLTHSISAWNGAEDELKDKL